jgi:hypothetical protein
MLGMERLRFDTRPWGAAQLRISTVVYKKPRVALRPLDLRKASRVVLASTDFLQWFAAVRPGRREVSRDLASLFHLLDRLPEWAPVPAQLSRSSAVRDRPSHLLSLDFYPRILRNTMS